MISSLSKIFNIIGVTIAIILLGCVTTDSGKTFQKAPNFRVDSEKNEFRNVESVIDIVLKNYVDPISSETILVQMIKGIEKKTGHTGLLKENKKLKGAGLISDDIAAQTPKIILNYCASAFPEYSHQDIADEAISGILDGLDPHCSLLPPEAFRELKTASKGSFSGIGISITVKDDFVTVISPIEGTPAYKAGIRQGDRILKVDNQVVKDLRSAVNMMRGPRGTKVKVSITRSGESEIIDYTLVRDIIPNISVTSNEVEPGYGYVWITHFRDNTNKALAEALDDLEKNQGPLKGLILDLRYNPGGLLPQAIKVSDLFLDNGTILSIRGRLSKHNKKYKARKNEFDRNYPIVVLINSGSASASEVVAGALQDNERAVIIGDNSFGKGSVQTIEPLNDGYGLKLTVARYFTPLGHSIQAKGIKPHIVVKKSDHIGSSKKDAIDTHMRDTKKVEHRLGPLNIERLQNDGQVQLALKSLKMTTSSRFSDLLLASKQVIAEYETTGYLSKKIIQPDKSPAKVKEIYDDKTPPVISLHDKYRSLEIVSSARHIFTGRAIDDSGVAIVKVNGKETALDSEGNFSASILLKPGSNQISITALDVFENQANKFVTINRESRGKPTLHNDIIQTGKFFALLIANEDYINPLIRDLNQPIQDAHRLKAVLQEAYTFDPKNILILENPKRADVIYQLDELSTELQADDNLLIFFAGHGFWDEQFRQGYWLLSDAKRTRRDAWLSNSTIRDYIRGINSKHTLLISDACFSGGIFKTRSTFMEASMATKTLYKRNSRKAMTSGTLKEVPDKSVFIDYLIKKLGENKEQYISSEQLFIEFKDAVINNSPTRQIPQFGEIREAGDEGGDFIFVRKK